MATWHAIFVMGAVYLLVAMVVAHIVSAGEDKYGYSGLNGPDKWGSLDPNYKLCSTGKTQSPINIEKKDLVYNSSLKSLYTNYFPTESKLKNNGHNVELTFERGAGTVFIDGKIYTLLRLHWHTPAEHTLDGEQYPVELHLVHQSVDGGIAVVAIMYKYGDADSFLKSLQNKLYHLATNEEVYVSAKEAEIYSFSRNTHSYYRYAGSLTTPPCTENVIWSILAMVSSISKEQVAILQAPLHEEYHNNARPTEELNGRVVELYDEQRKTKSLFV